MDNLTVTIKASLLLVLINSLCFAQDQPAKQAESLEQILTRVPSAPPGLKVPPLPEAPWRYDTGEGIEIEVEVVARGLNHPWAIHSLPGGRLLVSERDAGRLRVIEEDVLQAESIRGIPAVVAGGYSGLLDIMPHPNFANNHWLYLTYSKPLADKQTAIAVMRGTLDGDELKGTRDIFVADAGRSSGTSSLLFDDEGMLYVSLYGGSEDAQDLSLLRGKVLRLTEDGRVPPDNPFVDNDSARPEIYTYGHRTIQDLVLHPQTREIWAVEMGPNGGDEINILKPGANYGWPHVSLGRDYAGPWQSKFFQKPGFEDPVVYWMPSISVSDMSFYTGDTIAGWRGDLFVGGLRTGEIPGTGQLQRIRFNANGEEIRRETLLYDLHQRIRAVHQDDRGFLYVITDAEDGAVLKIGPVSEAGNVSRLGG